MSQVLTENHLERNLAALGARNDEIAHRLREAPPAIDLVFEDSAQGVPTARHQGRLLASRHRPLDEAKRLADQVDVVESAVVVALGFGVGYHVAELARRFDRTGVVIVFEPDLSLLRGIFERIDMSDWLTDSLVVFLHDASDRAALARVLCGAEGILAQGARFVEHAANRERLGAKGEAFARLFGDFVATAKTTLLTTLVRAANTVENQLNNLDHYALGPGITDLRNAARGFPAVLVSAGPSLEKNVHLLAEAGLRERCVIIAVQTTLKPLLEAGIRPHFVTALDYHEISRRFYDGLTAQDVSGVTLVAEPKAHPVILDSFPGRIRCCASEFLDRVLGDERIEMGALTAGATVAHLAFYLARHLGCDPVVLIGQDLGFTDGLYYARGTAIHDVWAPELNPFNTIEMMEWQRIVRHRRHLHKLEDVNGRDIFTDSQMLAYLQQFERDFAGAERDGVRVIDATEGGVRKQHVEEMMLADALDQYAVESLPSSFREAIELSTFDESRVDPQRTERVRTRIDAMRRDVLRIGVLSGKTKNLLSQMLASQTDARKMDRLFARLNRNKAEIEKIFDAFEVLNQINQVGVFKRQRSDRRIYLSQSLSPLERQRLQLERDLENVVWTGDAAAELGRLLGDAASLFRDNDSSGDAQVGTVKRTTPSAPGTSRDRAASHVSVRDARIAALIPVDPDRNGLGLRRSLAVEFCGRTIVQATLERVGRSRRLDSIVLLATEDAELDGLIDRERIGLPVFIEHCTGSPFGPEQEAVAAARMWAQSCWRGGIAGMSIYDEILCPQAMRGAMERHGLTAGVLVGPDWPFIDPGERTGIDAIVARHLERSDRHRLVFTQAPPGLSGCLLSAGLMRELAERNRLSTVGGLLIYQPHAPQGDPIARDANVQVDYAVQRSFIRATCDDEGRTQWLSKVAGALDADADAADVVAELERHQPSPSDLPHHLIVELTPERSSRGYLHRLIGRSRQTSPATARPTNASDISADLVRRLFAQFAESAARFVVTFAGRGDPLCHPQFDQFIVMAKEAGACGVHIRTELRSEKAVLDRLIAAPVDVISIDLHADRESTYRALMGDEQFREVLLNLEYVVAHRRRLTDQPGTAAFALPWVVPRMMRCALTYDDIDSFFDRWMATLGCALIEGEPSVERDAVAVVTDFVATGGAPLVRASTPSRVAWRELIRRMVIFSDGTVPVSEIDVAAAHTVGSLAQHSVEALWKNLCEERLRIRSEQGDDALELRTAWP